MTTDNGKIAERFLQHSKNLNGTMARSFETYNQNTINRKTNENTIKGSNQMSGGGNSGLDDKVTSILISAAPQLKDYVVAHGEIPFSDPVKLAVQATLIRAQDVATNASTLDITDEDALQNIENAEMAAQDINSPDNATVLTTDAQAAMKIAMDYISDLHTLEGGSGTMNDVLNDLQRAASTIPSVPTSNNLDGSDDLQDGIFDTGTFDYTPQASPITTGLATIPTDTTINPVTSLPTITAAAPTTDSSGLVNLGSGNSVLSSLTSILGSVSNLAGGVTQAANSVTNASTSVKNAIGNVGATSISTWLSQNSGLVIGTIAIVLGVIVFAIIYSKKK